MAATWVELVTGSLEQKRQYRRSRARIEALPEPYLTAAKAVKRYLTVTGGAGSAADGNSFVAMTSDLADLWEQAAADGTPVRDIVGADPVEFADTFAEAYAGKDWRDRARTRLIAAIEDAERGTVTTRDAEHRTSDDSAQRTEQNTPDDPADPAGRGDRDDRL